MCSFKIIALGFAGNIPDAMRAEREALDEDTKM
jgi:hypothetical protein